MEEDSFAWENTAGGEYFWDKDSMVEGSDPEVYTNSALCSPAAYEAGWMGALDLPLFSTVLAEFADLANMFSKQRATTLPPSWSNVYAINLLPGTVPPSTLCLLLKIQL